MRFSGIGSGTGVFGKKGRKSLLVNHGRRHLTVCYSQSVKAISFIVLYYYSKYSSIQSTGRSFLLGVRRERDTSASTAD